MALAACTQRVELVPVFSTDAAAHDAGAVEPQPDGSRPDAATFQLPSAEALLMVADALPHVRRVGTAAHRTAVAEWQSRLNALTETVERFPCDVVRWTPGEIDLRARSGTVTRSLAAVTSEASGRANLVDVPWIPFERLSEDYAGRVVVVPASLDSDLILRIREYPNVAGQTVAALFDTYWRLANQGAVGALFVLPESVPPSAAPAFPSVPDLTDRLPAAFISASEGALLDAWTPDRSRLTWSSSPTATATRAESLIARLPGPSGAPTVALLAPLDAPFGHRSFDAGLAVVWGVMASLASVSVEDRPVELVVISAASHWYDPGACLEAVIEQTVLDGFAGVDVVVDLFAPTGIDRASGAAAPRIAWRPAENDLLDRWLAEWPSQLSLRAAIPPGDLDGIERRLDAVPRLVISADFDHRYFRENATLPLPTEDMASLVADLVAWLQDAPALRAPRPTKPRRSETATITATVQLPGFAPAQSTLAARVASSTGATDAVVLAVGGLEAPAAVVYDGGPSIGWLQYLSSRGVAAYAVDVTGSGLSRRPEVMDAPDNWEDSDGARSADASYPFLLHSSESVVAEVGIALDWVAARHPGRRIHVVAQGLMGGYALWAARTWPDQIASVTMWGTPGLFIIPESPGPLPAEGRPARLLTRASLAARWGPMVRRLEQVDKRSLDTVWQQLIATEAPEVRALDRLRLPTVSVYGLTRELARAVDVPVLVAYGQYDRDAPAVLVRGLYDELTAAPRRWMIEVSGVSHFASWERSAPRVFELHRRWIDGEAANRRQGIGTFDGVTFAWEPD